MYRRQPIHVSLSHISLSLSLSTPHPPSSLSKSKEKCPWVRIKNYQKIITWDVDAILMSLPPNSKHAREYKDFSKCLCFFAIKMLQAETKSRECQEQRKETEAQAYITLRDSLSSLKHCLSPGFTLLSSSQVPNPFSPFHLSLHTLSLRGFPHFHKTMAQRRVYGVR